ncbi:hypothetical protein GGTG_13390 [Gaeumannomyces tritici R3-111a-1]|uniref:Uncharacterized protein n=1 Tax=Gaeumannomyces tritici (strain R3-111a-1) TaxID=644352 RepID=J3PIR1_GAET3|nr:hypothetical protein GGTG_13390 [Gaeumannomyces tritici R3-111a-1]EJT68993.1 hypothetical protein GGTG_13390 [Gaeumannomyces tritici R3-111a-1]
MAMPIAFGNLEICTSDKSLRGLEDVISNRPDLAAIIGTTRLVVKMPPSPITSLCVTNAYRGTFVDPPPPPIGSPGLIYIRRLRLVASGAVHVSHKSIRNLVGILQNLEHLAIRRCCGRSRVLLPNEKTRGDGPVNPIKHLIRKSFKVRRSARGSLLRPSPSTKPSWTSSPATTRSEPSGVARPQNAVRPPLPAAKKLPNTRRRRRFRGTRALLPRPHPRPDHHRRRTDSVATTTKRQPVPFLRRISNKQNNGSADVTIAVFIDSGRIPPRAAPPPVAASASYPLQKPLPDSQPLSRVNSPAFGPGGAAPFSLDAALKGRVSSCASRSAATATLTPSSSSSLGGLYGAKMGSSYVFHINENAPEQGITNLIQRSTCILGSAGGGTKVVPV